MKHYIGVTGAVTDKEVNSIINEFESAGYDMNSSHIPMIGFLVSFKTLNGKPTSNKRYPKFSQLKSLIEASKEKTFPMIHYNSKELNLSEQIENVFNEIYSNGLCKALQLNIVYPDKQELLKIKRKMPDLQIVFQASSKIVDNKNPKEIVKKIKKYGSTIDYILIDHLVGDGIEFDLDNSTKIYQELKNEIPNTTIGFARGFTENNVVRRVSKLIDILGDSYFSINAEEELRNKLSFIHGDDILDIKKVRNYLKEASKVLA